MREQARRAREGERSEKRWEEEKGRQPGLRKKRRNAQEAEREGKAIRGIQEHHTATRERHIYMGHRRARHKEQGLSCCHSLRSQNVPTQNPIHQTPHLQKRLGPNCKNGTKTLAIGKFMSVQHVPGGGGKGQNKARAFPIKFRNTQKVQFFQGACCRHIRRQKRFSRVIERGGGDRGYVDEA